MSALKVPSRGWLPEARGSTRRRYRGITGVGPRFPRCRAGTPDGLTTRSGPQSRGPQHVCITKEHQAFSPLIAHPTAASGGRRFAAQSRRGLSPGRLSRGVALAPGPSRLGSGGAGPAKQRGAAAAMGTSAPLRRDPLARGPHVSRGRARGRGRPGGAAGPSRG